MKRTKGKVTSFVLRKEKDGNIIAVFDVYANNFSTDLLACSLGEGHFSISRDYMYNNTKKATLKDGKQLYDSLLSNNYKFVSKLTIK